jgi:hypothetical protein
MNIVRFTWIGPVVFIQSLLVLPQKRTVQAFEHTTTMVFFPGDHSVEDRGASYFFFGGLIMICAPAVPGNISQGALSLDLVDSPVDSGVAKGT